ncbi:hypothetical protein M3Y97_00450700 [Aphelenchoides bicaudatus]|nr:hypothetical protein M3Y97_00450700 [Aphelenchoides bicaudatus]
MEVFTSTKLYIGIKQQQSLIVLTPINAPSKWKEDNGDYIELGNAGGYEVRWYNDGIVRFYKGNECDFRYHLDHQIDENTRIIYRQPIIKTPDCQ